MSNSADISSFKFPKDINPVLSADGKQCTISNNPDVTCTVCQEKCTFSFVNAILSADCSTFEGGLWFKNVNTDSLNPSPIKFNENDYHIQEMFLLVPAIGKYTDKTCCEYIIKAISSTGVLIICLPIIVSDTSESIALPQVIPYMLPSDGSSPGGVTVSSVSGISLSNYIPYKPFAFYKAPYSTGLYADYIVFPTTSLTIYSETKKDICSRISNTNCSTNLTNDPKYFEGIVYYNNKGTGEDYPSPDEIYIDCQPAGHSDDQTVFNNNDKQATSETFLENKGWFYAILVISILIVVSIVIRFLLNLFAPGKKITEALKMVVKRH